MPWQRYALYALSLVSDIAIFVLKRDVKLQLTNVCTVPVLLVMNTLNFGYGVGLKNESSVTLCEVHGIVHM